MKPVGGRAPVPRLDAVSLASLPVSSWPAATGELKRRRTPAKPDVLISYLWKFDHLGWPSPWAEFRFHSRADQRSNLKKVRADGHCTIHTRR
jgi:hypothetical protein